MVENEMPDITDSEFKREGIMFCLVGPAGSGKTTISEKILLVHSGTLTRSISFTTRPMRPGEVDGKDYHFVKQGQFFRMKDNEEFFETEEIHGEWYGTLNSNIENCINNSNDLLLVIDIKGALNLKKQFPENCVICFVLPESFAELEKRMLSRGNISPEELKTRLNTAKAEIDKLYQSRHLEDSIDYLIRNTDLKMACKKFHSIILSERLRFIRVTDSELLK